MQLDDSRGTLQKRDVVYEGKIVDLVVDKVEIEDETYVREVVRHPGGVLVLGEAPNGKIPFVRQHRYPMNENLLELPAGKIDPGEDPAGSAGRELEEETGYRATDLSLIYRFYSSPGFCDELLHFYHGTRLVKTSSQREGDEIIQVEEYTLREALELLDQGEILDAKTIVALLWLARQNS